MSKYDKKWMLMYSQLLNYKEIHGNCLVPSNFPGDPQLGRWIHKQRYSANKLSHVRRQLLDEIGFVWTVKAPKEEDQWNTMYGRLQQYKETHGNCLVPRKYKDDPQLGRWVSTQRAWLSANNTNSLSADRRQLLDQIGFVWTVKQDQWNTMYGRLQQYKETHGNCLVPRDFPGDLQLSRWVHAQRSSANIFNKLSNDRRQLLDQIGFVWKVYDTNWDNQYQKLVVHYKNYRTCLVPHKFDASLSRWVKDQRQIYKKGKLSSDRFKLLDDINFTWFLKFKNGEHYEQMCQVKKSNEQQGDDSVTQSQHETDETTINDDMKTIMYINSDNEEVVLTKSELSEMLSKNNDCAIRLSQLLEIKSVDSVSKV